MTVMRSAAQPELIYAILTDDAARAIVKALKKSKNPLAQELRAGLKAVMK